MHSATTGAELFPEGVDELQAAVRSFDQTGSWAPGVFTAAGIMIVSVFLSLMVKEKFPSQEEDLAGPLALPTGPKQP